MKKETLTQDAVYPHPVQRVWTALTKSSDLSQWLLPNNFEPLVGHRFTFTSNADQHIAVEDIIGEGDKVVVRSTFSGTQTGPLMGFPPTGKHCTQSQISIFRLASGKVIEYWFNADDLGMIRQLGLLPGPI